MTEPVADARTRWVRLTPSIGTSISIIVSQAILAVLGVDAYMRGELTGWEIKFLAVFLPVAALGVIYGTFGLVLALRRHRSGDVEA